MKWEEGATLICLPDVALVAIASSNTPSNLHIFCNVFAHSQPIDQYICSRLELGGASRQHDMSARCQFHFIRPDKLRGWYCQDYILENFNS